MNFSHKSLVWLGALAIGIVALSSRPLQAQSEQEKKAAVVISIASIDEQLKDVNYLSDAAGFGRLGGILINAQADEYLAGIDRTKPIGIFVHIDEENPQEPIIVGMIPVSDYDEVIDTISQFGTLEEGEIDKIAMGNGEDLFMKEKDGHAIFSNNKDAIGWLPDNPTKALGKMPENYNIAARVYGQRIPKSLRDQAIDAMRDGYKQQLEQSGADEEDLQQKSVEMQMKQMESLVNETKEFTMGLSADKAKNMIYMDFEMIGLEGSQLAKQAAEQKNVKPTRFGGFLMKESMFNANATSKLTADDIKSYKKLISSFKKQATEEMDLEGASEEEAAAVKGFVDTFFTVIEDTLAGGNTDAGVVIMGGESPSMAFGFHAVNASKLEDSIKKLAEVAKDSREIEVELNADSIGDIKLHSASIPVPDGEEEMQKLFGDNIEIVIGVNSNTVYFAAGDDAAGLLKKAVKNSSGQDKAKPMVMNLFVGKMLDMAASVEDEEMMAQMAEVLKESGKDRITIWTEVVKGGGKARLEIQDGILKLISVAAEQFGGGFGGADF